MRYLLIGECLAHSFSSVIHEKIGMYDYELCEIKNDELESFMKNRDFLGLNVTIPYKQSVIKYLDELTPEARLIGAVNTVINKNGYLIGHNTDFGGLAALIKRRNINIKNKKVLICGTGGTSNTAYSVCEKLGAKSITKLSRTQKENCITYDEALISYTDAEVIINTTPCGMYPDVDSIAIDIDKFPHLEAAIDVVYNPLSTKFILKAKKKGIKYIGGLYMLVMQAVEAAEFFTGKTISYEKANEIYNEIVKEKKNIVLIGMPSCGKTTVGRQIAKELNREFYDSDEYLVNKLGRSINDIFEKDSEEYFRDIEEKVIKELSMKSGVVIATGGGVILKEENMNRLAGNGYICFIDRDISLLTPTLSRPTADSKEKIKKLYETRYPLYLKYADRVFESKENIKSTAKDIGEKFLSENFSD